MKASITTELSSTGVKWYKWYEFVRRARPGRGNLSTSVKLSLPARAQSAQSAPFYFGCRYNKRLKLSAREKTKHAEIGKNPKINSKNLQLHDSFKSTKLSFSSTNDKLGKNYENFLIQYSKIMMGAKASINHHIQQTDLRKLWEASERGFEVKCKSNSNEGNRFSVQRVK